MIQRNLKRTPGERRRKGSCDPGLDRESRAQEMLGAAVHSVVALPTPVAVPDWASLVSQLPATSSLGQLPVSVSNKLQEVLKSTSRKYYGKPLRTVSS